MGDIEIAKKLGFGPLFIVQKMLVHLHKYLVQFSWSDLEISMSAAVLLDLNRTRCIKEPDNKVSNIVCG